jgi:hypothetical protein
MQDTMRRLQVGRCTASHHVAHRRHGAFPRSKDGTGHQDVHVLPNRSGKDGAKTPMTLVKVIGKESMAILSV